MKFVLFVENLFFTKHIYIQKRVKASVVWINNEQDSQLKKLIQDFNNFQETNNVSLLVNKK